MKSQRLQDFQNRAANESSGARKLPAGGEIVTIHPMADEDKLLADLEMNPFECFAVDGYWAVDGDVVFLQLHAASMDTHRAPGLYAQLATHPPKHVNLLVVVKSDTITSKMLERETARLKQVGWDRSRLGDTLVPLS